MIEPDHLKLAEKIKYKGKFIHEYNFIWGVQGVV